MPGELTEQCLRPHPGLGVHTQGAHPESRVCVPTQGWGCTRGPSREEGLGGTADVGSSPQVAVGP